MEDYLLPYFDRVNFDYSEFGTEDWYLRRLDMQIDQIRLGNRLLVTEYWLKYHNNTKEDRR